MTTTAQYVAGLQAQQRALRHAASLPLLVTTLGTGFLAWCEIATDWWIFPQALVPAVAFAALFMGMRVQRQLLGIGTGRDAYGLLAFATILLTLFPGPVLSIFLGAGFFLGIGLVALGTLEGYLPVLGSREGGLVLSTAVLLLLTVAAFVRERRVVTADPADPADPA